MAFKCLQRILTSTDGQPLGLDFAVFIDREGEVGLLAFSDRPGGFPLPAFLDLAVLEFEAFGIAVDPADTGLVIAAQHGAKFPTRQGRVFLKQVIPKGFCLRKGFAFSSPVFVGKILDVVYAPSGQFHPPGVGTKVLAVDA